jgi:hypothetical protein
MSVNWGLAQGPNAFENSLSRGFELGQAAKQKKDQRDSRNALSAYAANPNEETLLANAPYNPQLVMQERERMAQRDAAAQKQAGQGVQDFRPVLKRAMQSPEDWALVRNAHQQGGGDVTNIPQDYSPDWAKGQLMILEASNAGIDLTNSAKEVMLSLPPEQRDVNHPAFIAAMGSLLEQQLVIDPGGSVVGYNPVTGNSRQIVRPGNPPTGEQPDNAMPPEGSVVESPGGRRFVVQGGRLVPQEGGRGAGVTATFLD